jgi:hypothetical protein
MNTGNGSARLGEVIATSTTQFEAQCVRLHEAPPLGSLVRVRASDELTVFGLVAGALTDGVDAGVRPVPRGRDGAEDAEVFRAHPDLVHVLRTCVQCLVVGYREWSVVWRHLPPTPAPIHYSVTPCQDEELLEFTSSLEYFRMVLEARDVPSDEVLAAHIRLSADARSRSPRTLKTPYDFTVEAGRELAKVLRDDHRRLMPLLHRIERTAGPDPRRVESLNGHPILARDGRG